MTLWIWFQWECFLLVITDTFNVAFFFFTCQKLWKSIFLCPLKIFSIGQSMPAAAAWSNHFCYICFVVFIVTCGTSCLASGVWVCGEHQTDVRISLLASLAVFPRLAALPRKHLPTPPPSRKTKNKKQNGSQHMCNFVCTSTLRFTVAGSEKQNKTKSWDLN